MNQSSDAAEQLVRMSLNGVEVVAKISGEGAVKIAKMLAAASKEQHKTKGKTRLENMLKSGQPLRIYTLRNEDLQVFCQEAKKYGVLYCVLKDKGVKDGKVDIMVREFDSPRVSRILDRFNLSKVDMASVQTKIEKDIEEQSVFDSVDKAEQFLDRLLSGDSKENDIQNSVTARTEKSNQSEPFSKMSNNHKEFSKSDKPSVRKQLKEFKAQEAVAVKTPTRTKTKER